MIYADAKVVDAAPARIKVTPPADCGGYRSGFTCSVEQAVDLIDRLTDATCAAHVENVKRGFKPIDEALKFGGEDGILVRAKRLIRNIRGK